MRRRKSSGISEMEAGQDSFLDIVSNIVGILIILVMIAGVRTKGLPARTKNDGDLASPLEQSLEVFTDKSQTFKSVQAEVAEIGNEIEHLQGLTAARTQERYELTALLGALQAEYDDATQSLSQAEKQSLELRLQIQKIDAKLEELERTKQWIGQNRPQATVLENLPTPHAKTVEKNEVHFRIKNGKILHVPFSALFDKMGSELRNRLSLDMKPGELTGIVGPIENFTMPYRIVVLTNAPGLASGGIRVEFAESAFIPQDDQLGETLQEALLPNSEFQRRIMGYRQDLYTITFWVYPDSFDAYQTMKKYLFERGYQTAARPLNWNDPIGASSEGTKSQAQ
ncbi:MAG: hypothetical protein FWC43_06225 [Planctomycetaceae bacterium]|nr:hypothetical protein [Planctomycetaceae bacterium]